MRTVFLNLSVLIFILSGCNSKPDPYAINKQSIGLLTDSTLVKDIELSFLNDSITQFIDGDEFLGKSNIIKVYEKETEKLLLELSPKEALDSLSTIQNVRVMDPRFKTIKGLNKNATFQIISSQYRVSSIQNTIRNLIVSVDEMNLYFTIEKTELPENLRYDLRKKIEAVSIPPKAKIKDFYIQWY